MRAIPAITAALLLLGTFTAQAQTGKTGWWIRIDPAATEATSIELLAGSSRGTLAPWMVWKKGDASEFQLPEALRTAESITIRGTTTPNTADAVLCVFNGDIGAEHMDFDGVETETIDRDDRSSKCR